MTVNTKSMRFDFNLDKLAIGLSALCAIHCLFLPVAIILVPALTATVVGDEIFHRWMLLVVIPTSLFALTLGCRRHRNNTILATALLGLGIMIYAALFGHDHLGEFGEKAATLIGACILSLGHWWNHTACREANCSH